MKIAILLVELYRGAGSVRNYKHHLKVKAFRHRISWFTSVTHEWKLTIGLTLFYLPKDV